MNKLTVLYNMMKKARETEACSGTASVELRLDESILGTIEASFNHGEGRCGKTVKAQFGDETLNFDHQGKECGHHGRGHHGAEHRHHGCCAGGRLDKAMFMLKLLDRLELQEPGNGMKLLTLTLRAEDLSDVMKGHMKHHGVGKCCRNEALLRRLAEFGLTDPDFDTAEPETISLRVMVKPDYSVHEVNAAFNGSIADKGGIRRMLSAVLTASHR